MFYLQIKIINLIFVKKLIIYEITRTIVFKTGKEFKDYLRQVNIMPESFNRGIKPSHAKKMRKSLEAIKVQRAINIIETDVFDGTTKKYIADGQHLRNAILTTEAGELGSHLVAFVSKTDSLGDIIPFVSRMNSTAKNWNSTDYLNSWATHGLENYQYIQQKRKDTKISVSALVTEIFGISSEGTVLDDFKNGELKLNKARGTDIIRTYEQAVALGLTKCSSSLVATARLLKSHPTVKEDFLTMIKKNVQTFQHRLNKEAYVTLFKNFLGLETKGRKYKKA